MANYPGSVTTFATRSAGQKIASAHVNALQDEVNALEDALLTTGLEHNLFPESTADARTLGTSSKYWGLSYLKAVCLLDASELTIASGVITATQGYHKIDTEANAASDDLDTITAGSGLTAGTLLVVRAEDVARVVTLKDGTGNLLLNGDFALSATDRQMLLIYDGTNWREIARSSGSVSISGTPANDQVAVWTAAATLEGTANFTQSSAGVVTITSTSQQFVVLNSTHASGGYLEVQQSGSARVRTGDAQAIPGISGGAGAADGAVIASGGYLWVEGASGVKSEIIDATTTATAANVVIESLILKKNSSSLKNKNWRPLTLDEARRVLALTPIAFTSKLPADDPAWLHFGFGAEPTYDVAPSFGRPNRENYDVNAIVAGLTRVVQDLDARVAQMEAA